MLVKVKKTVRKRLEKNSKVKLNINTLIPHFTYKNDKGESMKPKNCCIQLYKKKQL